MSMTPFDLTARVIRKSGYFSARVGEVVVLMTSDGAEYCELNLSATRIWDLTETETTLGAIIDKLVEEFEVDRSECMKEVFAYLADENGNGFITIANIGSGES